MKIKIFLSFLIFVNFARADFYLLFINDKNKSKEQINSDFEKLNWSLMFSNKFGTNENTEQPMFSYLQQLVARRFIKKIQIDCFLKIPTNEYIAANQQNDERIIEVSLKNNANDEIKQITDNFVYIFNFDEKDNEWKFLKDMPSSNLKTMVKLLRR